MSWAYWFGPLLPGGELQSTTFVVPADAGSYALTGTAATLTYTPVLTNKIIVADPGSYVLTGTPATLTYVPIATGVAPTRGEWPVKKRDRSANIQAARQARDSLRQALERLYDGGDYDAPVEVLEGAQSEAVAAVNAFNLLPDIPLDQLKIAEDLIRRIQELLRLRLLDEAQAEMATAIAQQHLRETIDMAAEVYRKTRFDYLARYALLTVE